MGLRHDLAASLLLEAARAHIAARDALEDVPAYRLTPDDPRFAAVTDTLEALRSAVTTAAAACGVMEAASPPSGGCIERTDFNEHDARFADIIRSVAHPRLPDVGMEITLRPKLHYASDITDAILGHVAAMHIAALEARERA